MTAFGFADKKDTISSHKGRCLSLQIRQILNIAPPGGGRTGRDEKTSTEENLPPTPFKQDGKMRLVPLPTSLLPGQQEGCPPLLLTVLLLPGFSCSWRFSVVTWGFFFSLMPGIICGSIYKSKVFVINPTQVPEGVMPGKWFGKVSRGQGPK